MELSAISWVAVILGGIAFFLIGGIWYGPLFGKLWMRETGMTEERARESNLPLIFGSTFVLETIGAIGLAAVLGKDVSVAGGLVGGLLVGLLIVATSLAVQVIYERRSSTLWALNAGYNVIGFAAMGAIIGAFQ